MKRMASICKSALLSAALALGVPQAVASENSVTPDVLLKDSLTLSCIDYRSTGMCFWLKCGWSGCSIRTSPQVEHYNPDVVMEVTSTDRLPMKWLTGPIDKAASGVTESLFKMSLGQRRKNVKAKASYQFYDVSEVGNPILPLYNNSVGEVLGLIGWCGSKVDPLYPYFNTKVDPDWRLGIAEALLTIPNMTKVVGSAKDHWAPVYPRTGAVVHSDIYRSAAGAAFRSGHVTTRSSQPHIYRQLPTDSHGGKTWGPKPLEINEGGSRPSNKWQLNYPRSKGSSCYQIPEDTGTNVTGELSTIESDLENYVLTMWRKYKCCKSRGKFLYSVEW